MTLDEFQAELRTHDWFYEFSDDSRTFRKGRENAERLWSLAKSDEAFMEAYTEYRERMNRRMIG